MKYFYITLILLALTGCWSNCEKKNLTPDQRNWVSHFKHGQRFLYKSAIGKIDTLDVTNINDYYTPCNKLELSKYQNEVYGVSFVFKSKNNYNKQEADISFSLQEWKARVPYIYLGNLGPFKINTDNKMPIAIDTLLDGKKFDSVYYYAKNLNTEQYGTEYFKSFFWNKKSGLVAYTTINDEFFTLMDK